MAFKDHPFFKPAPSRDSKLWRYMGLPKFLSLLQQKALFFCNLELMARDDSFEGTLPASRFIHRNWNSVGDIPEQIRDKLKGFMKPEECDLEIGLERLKDLAELRIRQAYAHRRSYFINCWHLSEYESSAMWDIYSKRNEGIAILSSEAHFEKAFSSEQQDIMGGEIAYGDYHDEDFKIDETNGFTPVLHKRNSFSYENEYRLVNWDTSVTHKKVKAVNGFIEYDGKRVFSDFPDGALVSVGRPEAEIEKLEIKHGLHVKCEIDQLIDAVYISPLAEDWFFEVVKDISAKYDLNVPIIKSELISEPLK